MRSNSVRKPLFEIFQGKILDLLMSESASEINLETAFEKIGVISPIAK
jgi:hypothetical protein